MKITLKHKIAALATAATIVGGSGVALAYFTTTGSGTGAGTAGTSTALVLHGSAPTSLYPGTTSPVSFTVDNSSPGHQYVATIKLVSVSTDSAHAACDVTKFTMPDVVANQDVASGSGIAITAGGTLTMLNSPTSQDACKGAPLTLHLTSN